VSDVAQLAFSGKSPPMSALASSMKRRALN
jgi:hypothetical protein